MTEKEWSNRSSRIASNLVLLLMPRTFSDAIDIVLEQSERQGELSSDKNLSLMLELILSMLELSGTLTIG